ncbi:hypothetical protein ACFL6Y_08050 [Elusimicrobiota bacterium]
MRLSISQKINAGFAIAMLVLIGIGIFSYSSAARFIKTSGILLNDFIKAL